MGDQITSKPDHGDKIILEAPNEKGGVASPRFQLFLDDLTDKLNTFLLDPGAVNTIYAADDTVGSGRIATLTDTLAFHNGRVGFSNFAETPTDGIVHIIDSSAGIVDSHPDGSELVLEHDFDGGMSILQPDGSFGNIFFGSPSLGNQAGNIFFHHQTSPFQSMGLNIAGLTAIQMFTTGTFVNPSQNSGHNFQVNTVGSSPFLQVDAANNRMGLSQGVSFAPTDGVLHIHKGGSAGVVTADPTADNLVLESDTQPGMSILSPNDQQCRIFFGDPDDATRGLFQYNHFIDEFQIFFANVTTFCMAISPINGFKWNPDQLGQFDFEIATIGSRPFLFVDASANRLGISDASITPTDGLVHLIQGSLAGVVTASPFGNILVLEHAGAGNGISFLSPADSQGRLLFGDPDDNVKAAFQYNHFGDAFEWYFNSFAFIPLRILTSSGFHWNPSQVTQFDFRLDGSVSTHCLFLDASAQRMSISNASLAGTDGLLHIIQGATAGGITASASADTLVLEGTGQRGLSILVDNATGIGNIGFGDPTNGNFDGRIAYTAASRIMSFQTSALERLKMGAVEAVFNDTGADTDLRAESNGNASKLFLNAGIDELQTTAGTAGVAFANIGGNLNINNGTQGSTAIATEETLLSFSLLANSLSQPGRGVRIKAWGTTAANATLKQIRLKFGATHVFDSANVAANGETWHFVAEVYRTGAATQDGIGFQSFYDTATPTIVPALITAPAETLSGAITIAVTSTVSVGAAANDVVAEGFSVEYI